jgi:hypothetical protein
MTHGFRIKPPLRRTDQNQARQKGRQRIIYRNLKSGLTLYTLKRQSMNQRVKIDNRKAAIKNEVQFKRLMMLEIYRQLGKNCFRAKETGGSKHSFQI